MPVCVLAEHILHSYKQSSSSVCIRTQSPHANAFGVKEYTSCNVSQTKKQWHAKSSSETMILEIILLLVGAVIYYVWKYYAGTTYFTKLGIPQVNLSIITIALNFSIAFC